MTPPTPPSEPISFVSTGGHYLRTIEVAPSTELAAGQLVTLDASGVRYRVVPRGPERIEGSSETSGERSVHVEPVFSDSPVARAGNAAGIDATSAATTVKVPSTDGVEVALHHFGGTGPVLVICHATGFNAGAYAPLAAELAPAFDVWGIDLRGHGASTAPDSENFAWTGMGEDLLACIEAIDAGPVYAVGHSMGGAAIMIAELAKPGSIIATYLYEPIIFPGEFLTRERRENPMSGPARARREIFPSRQAAYDRYASRPPLQLLRPDALAGYVQHGFDDLSATEAQAVDAEAGSVRLACRAEHEARTFECSLKVTIEEVSELALPTTVGAGTTEPAASPAEFAPLIAKAMPAATLISYEGLGHFGPLVDPVRIADDIAASLRVRNRA